MHSVYYNHSSNLYKGNIQSIQISFLLFRFVLSDLRSPGEIVFHFGVESLLVGHPVGGYPDSFGRDVRVLSSGGTGAGAAVGAP